MIHLRWRVILQAFVCSRKGHDPDQYRYGAVWHAGDHYCRRCALIRPSSATKRIRGRIASATLDWDGNVVGGVWRMASGVRLATLDEIHEGLG